MTLVDLWGFVEELTKLVHDQAYGVKIHGELQTLRDKLANRDAVDAQDAEQDAEQAALLTPTTQDLTSRELVPGDLVQATQFGRGEWETYEPLYVVEVVADGNVKYVNGTKDNGQCLFRVLLPRPPKGFKYLRDAKPPSFAERYVKTPQQIAEAFAASSPDLIRVQGSALCIGDAVRLLPLELDEDVRRRYAREVVSLVNGEFRRRVAELVAQTNRKEEGQ